MTKDHLKRLAAPKTWNIQRKDTIFITRPTPGAHSMATGMPINVVMREMLGYANSTKEVKRILASTEVNVDGRKIKDYRFIIGLFDTLELKNIPEYFRVILTRKGKLQLIKVKKDQASVKPCKIVGKKSVKGKSQLNLYDGRNVLVDKNEHKVGDTVLLSLPDQKINKHLKLEKNAAIFLTGGRHIGSTGVIQDIIENKIIYKDSEGNLIETLKKYAFVVGKDKPEITLK